MAAELYGASRDEFVTALAALALYDGEAEISSDNINALLKASNNTGVKPYWPALMAGVLKGGRIESIIFSGGVAAGGAPAAAGAAPAAAGGDAAPAGEKKKEEEKPKEEEVDALDGGMDMFGGGGGGGGGGDY